MGKIRHNSSTETLARRCGGLVVAFLPQGEAVRLTELARCGQARVADSAFAADLPQVLEANAKSKAAAQDGVSRALFSGIRKGRQQQDTNVGIGTRVTRVHG